MTAAMALCGIGCKLCIIGVALIGFQSVVLILGAAVHGCVGVCVCVCACVCVSVRESACCLARHVHGLILTVCRGGCDGQVAKCAVQLPLMPCTGSLLYLNSVCCCALACGSAGWLFVLSCGADSAAPAHPPPV